MGGGGRSGISGWGNQGKNPRRGAFAWVVDPTGELFSRRRR